MSNFIGDWNALLILLLAGVLPNEIWRVIGLLIGKRIREDSELLVWVRAVATAILAGVIVQILLVPPGALALVPPLIRYTSLPVGFAAYLAARKSVPVGVIVGDIYVVAWTWWMI
ncbi:MAG: AzlD domain-containing protein [Bradyrhizobiaceae bacterium]|nr:MAG: AzlD domain-containing protein [Bradyrhizobiaceae bacterium]